VNGFLNMLIASKKNKVKNFVYASSSSVYGDHIKLPKIESVIGNLLSPYAATKFFNEIYAKIFFKVYGFRSIGLRYFNVFGKRQDPKGSYAAVIPKWIFSMIKNKKIIINGDGKTTRDFCYIENTIQANIFAALCNKNRCEIYNVASGSQISLNKLFFYIKKTLVGNNFFYKKKPIYRQFRKGDVRHSLADLSKIKKDLNYTSNYSFYDGILKIIPWYIFNKKLYEKNNK